jgi:CheY-like chemotaxis protein
MIGPQYFGAVLRSFLLVMQNGSTVNSKLSEERLRTVLIVDDDAAVRRTMARFLEFKGFDVIEAEDGQGALAYLLGGGEVNIVVLDLQMPVMDGWAFRRAQRREPGVAHIPVVVVSAADGNRFHELDAAAEFHKPVSLAALADCLHRICESQLNAENS